MALTLVLGPPAGGKTGMITDRIAETIRQKPDTTVIYLTPEQMTLKAEQMLMRRMGVDSLLGMPVVGFKRLAYAVFEEVGLPAVTWLDDVGKCMVLQRICREHKAELRYYGRSIMQKGFIDRLKMMITEIIQYQLDEQTLTEMAESQKEGSILRDKLSDIALLWHYFTEYIQTSGEGRLLASETMLDEFARMAERSAMIRGAEVFVDGFTGFTPQQYRILEKLLLYAENVTVALSLSREAWKKADQVRDWRDLPVTLYFTPQKTFSKLSALSRNLGVKREIRWIDNSGRNRAPELCHALTWLMRNETRVYPDKVEHIRVMSALSAEEEIDRCLREILYLVREKHFDFRDIALVTTDLSGCAHSLRRKATLYGIPVFVDDKAEIKLNPMVQWMEAVCQMLLSDFSGESFLSFLKTGFSGISRELVDSIENTALKENWNGEKRIVEGLRIYTDKLAGQLELLSRRIFEAGTAEDYTEALWELADGCRLQESLAEEAEILKQENLVEQALRFERIYDQIRNMTDQLGRILGSIPLSFEDYTAMLKIGIGECRMGQLPATLDEVSVGDLNRSKVESCRAVFFLGMQEGGFPSVSSGGSLLTDTERTHLRSHAFAELAQGEKEDLMEQYYLLQQAMGKASDYVYFSSHTQEENGKPLGESPIWRRLDRLFGLSELQLDETGREISLPVPMIYEGTFPDGAEDLIDNRETAARVETLLLQAAGGKEPGPEQEPLSAGVAIHLMNPTLRPLSVSQLEMYAECPYQYYLKYGLNLKERELPKVGNLEDGTVIHDLLSAAGDYLSQVLTEEEADRIVADLSKARESTYRVYQTSSRFRYYWEKMQQKAARSLRILADQVALGDFSASEREWEFTDRPVKGHGDPLTIRLKDGKEIKLQGKIDRVDLWDDGEKRYIRIIDYKTGHTSFEWTDFFSGVQLQLPVYMDAASRHFRAEPAGIFYFRLTPEETEGQTVLNLGNKALLQKSLLEGVLLKDEAVAVHMDRELEPGGASQVFYGSMNKNGTLAKKGIQLLPEQFARMASVAEKKSAELAEDILTGKVERSPLRKGSKSPQTGSDLPCAYCAFRGACGFDPRRDQNHIRQAEKVSQKDGADRLEQELI